MSDEGLSPRFNINYLQIFKVSGENVGHCHQPQGDVLRLQQCLGMWCVLNNIHMNVRTKEHWIVKIWPMLLEWKNICETQYTFKYAVAVFHHLSAWWKTHNGVEMRWCRKVGDLWRVRGILNKEGYHSIFQYHAISCGQPTHPSAG